MEENPYDAFYKAIQKSAVYAEVLREALASLPDWIVPLSVTSREDLERVATLLDVRPGQHFCDLACGLGGSTLWISERTGAACTGVDYSAVAVSHATRLAQARGLHRHARFVVADITNTNLLPEAFDALVSVDSVQFVDSHAVASEISRIIRPGGIAVIRTWEAVTDELPRPTMVRDYAPAFAHAGMEFASRDVLSDDRERSLQFFGAIDRRADRFRTECGDAIEPLLEEAATMMKRAAGPARVRKVLLKFIRS